MDPKEAYNNWSKQYDSNLNKTRDLEALSLRNTLAVISFDSCLEIGCGTGKNTAWLLTRAGKITAVDLSPQMLAIAKIKINSEKVEFIEADINTGWAFTDQQYQLVSFSLVLEHIENLEHIFTETTKLLKPGGFIYIGELHPFKQYTGSKARFETEEGLHIVSCFTHHISEFTQLAKKFGYIIADLNEYFDAADSSGIPRILTLLLQKQ
jgi:ubiquinone/menaquinone biosynthesis C-methylase UbiE